MALNTPLPVFEGRYSHWVVPHLGYVPIVDGAAYALDLDNTLITTTTVFDQTGPTGANGKAKWRREVVKLHHPAVLDWFQRVEVEAPTSTVIYATARDLTEDQITQQQFSDLSLPKHEVVYAFDKGPPISEYAQGRPIIFVDDLTRNHHSVLRERPDAQCYRVDSQLYSKLLARQRKQLRSLK